MRRCCLDFAGDAENMQRVFGRPLIQVIIGAFQAMG
jgi:hypothetical protein